MSDLKTNGYNLSRKWFDFRFDNPSKVRSIHTELFLYIVDQWNRLGQKKEFGLPTSKTMEMLSVGSYNTYSKALKDLVDFGFVIIVLESKNQYKAKVIAISKIDEASDLAYNKALDKAVDEPIDKASTNPIDKASDYIDELINKETKKLINKETKELLSPLYQKLKKVFEENPIKPLNNEKQKVYSIEVNDVYDFSLKHFDEELKPKDEKQKNSWLDTIDKLNRIDGVDFPIIKAVIKNARQDDFWNKQFQSLNKLRSKDKQGLIYFVVFYNKFKPKEAKDYSQEMRNTYDDIMKDPNHVAHSLKFK